VEITEEDLQAFKDDWMIADKAESTVNGYLVYLRK
jgi:hypothetical protein